MDLNYFKILITSKIYFLKVTLFKISIVFIPIEEIKEKIFKYTFLGAFKHGTGNNFDELWACLIPY